MARLSRVGSLAALLTLAGLDDASRVWQVWGGPGRVTGVTHLSSACWSSPGTGELAWAFTSRGGGQRAEVLVFSQVSASCWLTSIGQSRSYGDVQVMRLWYVFHTYEWEARIWHKKRSKKSRTITQYQSTHTVEWALLFQICAVHLSNLKA